MLKKVLPNLNGLLLACCRLCPTVWADTANDEFASATRVMIKDLGLRESATPVRDLPGWRKPAKVVAWLDRPERLPALQAVAPGVEIVPAASVEEARREVAGAQVLLGFCDEEILAQGAELHWVQVYWSGVEDCVTNPGMLQGDKLLTNGQAIASPALA